MEKSGKVKRAKSVWERSQNLKRKEKSQGNVSKFKQVVESKNFAIPKVGSDVSVFTRMSFQESEKFL